MSPELEVGCLSSQLDPKLETPMFRQIYLALRHSILNGELAPGYRLLPSRTLSERLGISRTTITQAYRQLLAEGFTEGLSGSGTRVCRTLPVSQPSPVRSFGRALSARGLAIQEERLHYEETHFHAEAFCPAAIDKEHFPAELWGRSLSRVWRKQWQSLFDYQGPDGYQPLRQVICDYLAERRELRCLPEQVVVVAGAQQGLDLCARVLTDPGDFVGLENPGYLGARLAFRAAGARCLSIAVDEEGLSVSQAAALQHPLRAVYVSPSHQFPTGVSMTLSRRLALLELAEARDLWIIEDDYDSEFRYNSRPVASLKSLDERGRVIYVGSFSKVLHPSLRVGYMVLPDDLVTAFHGAKACADRQTNLLLQAALVDFLECEEFGRHLKRMREIYGERRQQLVSELQRRCGGCLTVPDRDEAGLHVSAWLPAGCDDWQLSLAAREHDLELNSFRQYSGDPPEQAGLVLGFAGLNSAQIAAGAVSLERFLTQFFS